MSLTYSVFYSDGHRVHPRFGAIFIRGWWRIEGGRAPRGPYTTEAKARAAWSRAEKLK